MSVYAYVYVCVYAFQCLHLYMRTGVFVYLYVHVVYVYTHAHAHVYELCTPYYVFMSYICRRCICVQHCMHKIIHVYGSCQKIGG